MAVKKEGGWSVHGDPQKQCMRRGIDHRSNHTVEIALMQGGSKVCGVFGFFFFGRRVVVNAGGAATERGGVGCRIIHADVTVICGLGRFLGHAMGDVVNPSTRVGRRPIRSCPWLYWPSPPSTPSPFPNAQQILVEWGRTQGLWGYKLGILGALFYREYHLQLPLPRGCKGFDNLANLEPRQFRYLFRRQCAVVLGWKKRILEGDPNGFSEELNRSIREEVWCDV